LNTEIKLLVIDFDGTALGGYQPYERFPDNFCFFLEEITRYGYQWATCTTWHPFSQEQVFAASHLQTRPIRCIGRTSLSCGLYIRGKLYLDAAWDAEMIECKSQFMQESATAIRQLLQSLPDSNSFIEYFDFVFAVNYRKREEIEKLLRNPTIQEKTYCLFSSTENTLFLFPWYLSKGLAVKKLQKLLHLAPKNILVAGDGINDLPMMAPDVCQWLICPENADIQVKEIVSRRGGIVSNFPYSDGVVQAARKILRLM